MGGTWALTPGAASEGAQNSLTKDILWLTEVGMIKLAERARNFMYSLSQQSSARAYSKRVPRTNCALRIKKCAPRISSGNYF